MNNSYNLNDYYFTHDLALASAISLFYPLETIDRTNPHKALFIFKKSKELEEFVETYWRGEITVNPSSYFQQIKLIKTRLYERR